ncbi:MAG: hypothetical protein ACKVI6_05945 [Candidatus Poseidoniales archaeon]
MVPEGSSDIDTVGGELSSKKSVHPEKNGQNSNITIREARGRVCFIIPHRRD